MNMVPPDNDNVRSKNEVELLIVGSLLHTKAHYMTYSGACRGSRVCPGLWEGVSIVLCKDTYPMHIWLIND